MLFDGNGGSHERFRLHMRQTQLNAVEFFSLSRKEKARYNRAYSPFQIRFFSGNFPPFSYPLKQKSSKKRLLDRGEGIRQKKSCSSAIAGGWSMTHPPSIYIFVPFPLDPPFHLDKQGLRPRLAGLHALTDY